MHRVYQGVLKWLFILTNALAFAFNTADFFYFDFIQKRMTAEVFMFANEGNILKLFGLFFIDYWMGILFWLFVVFMLIRGYTYFPEKIEKGRKTIRFYLVNTGWLLVVLYLSIVSARGGFTGTTRPITLGNAGAYTHKPKEMAIVLNTPFSIIRTLNKGSVKKKSYFKDEKLAQIYSPEHKVKTGNQIKPLNVVVLVIESFGREYIGAYNKHNTSGNYKSYTPFVDSLINHSKSFKYAFANGRKSIDALPSVVAGVLPIPNPFVTSVYASNEITGLGNLLKKKGYETAFFHGAPNGSMGFDAFMKIAGYDQYFGLDEYGNRDDFDGAWGIWDEEFMQFMGDEMGKLPEPFHATFFSVSSHHPFKVPEKYEGAFDKGTLDIHAPIQYTDMALKKFFQKVSKEEWFQNTLFVLTADHANQSYYPEYKTALGAFAVPLIFYQAQDSALVGMESRVGQQIDIIPSVLSYLNYDEDYFSFGFNLFDEETNNFAVNYNNNTYQIIYDTYVLQRVENKNMALYNFINDPLLKDDLLGQGLPAEQDLDTLLKAFSQQYINRIIENRMVLSE
jgi:phosphoglycerol transferase MdoB-like AlkP superfamily enzyme